MQANALFGSTPFSADPQRAPWVAEVAGILLAVATSSIFALALLRSLIWPSAGLPVGTLQWFGYFVLLLLASAGVSFAWWSWRSRRLLWWDTLFGIVAPGVFSLVLTSFAASGQTFSIWAFPLIGLLFGSATLLLAASQPDRAVRRMWVGSLCFLGLLALSSWLYLGHSTGQTPVAQWLARAWAAALGVYALVALWLGQSLRKGSHDEARKALVRTVIGVAFVAAFFVLSKTGDDGWPNVWMQLALLSVLLLWLIGSAKLVSVEVTVNGAALLGLLFIIIGLMRAGSEAVGALQIGGVIAACLQARHWRWQLAFLAVLAGTVTASDAISISDPWVGMNAMAGIVVLATLLWLSRKVQAVSGPEAAVRKTLISRLEPTETRQLWVNTALAAALTLVVGLWIASSWVGKVRELSASEDRATVSALSASLAQEMRFARGLAELAVQRGAEGNWDTDDIATLLSAYRPLLPDDVALVWAEGGVVSQVARREAGVLDLKPGSDLLHEGVAASDWLSLREQRASKWLGPARYGEGASTWIYFGVPVFQASGPFKGFLIAMVDIGAHLAGLEVLVGFEMGQGDGAPTLQWRPPGWQEATPTLNGRLVTLNTRAAERGGTRQGRAALQGFAPGVWWLRLQAQAKPGPSAWWFAAQVLLTAITLLSLLAFFGTRMATLRRRDLAHIDEAKRLEAMLQVSSVGAILSNASGRVNSLNSKAADLLGLAPSQDKPLTLTGEEGLSAMGWQRAWTEPASGQEPLRWDFQGEGPKGRRLDLQITASPVLYQGKRHWLFELLDLSELHEREKELAAVSLVAQRHLKEAQDARQIAERVSADLQDLYDNAPCGYHSLDSFGRVVSINAVELKWLGKTKEQVVLQNYEALLSSASADAFRTAFQNVLRGQTMEGLELDLVGSDERTLLPVSVSASLARGPSDEVLYVRMAVFDNRERRQRELELALAVDQALVASQAKSQFLSIMSHEIRTPLNWVMGMLQVLAYRKDLPASAKKQVDTAYEGTELLLAVLNDVLDFSSLSAGKFTLHPKPGRIFAAMTAIKSLVGQLPAKPAVTMFVSIDPRLNTLVEVDATRLRQVLLNLLNNAIKFTDEGSIKLSALVSSESDDELVVEFAVQDTGIGMDQTMMTRLFEPFTQADMSDTRRYSGTGLGLAISRDIVAAMGGDLQVQSQRGAGTLITFSLTLQRCESSTGQKHIPDVRFPGSGLRGQNVFHQNRALESRTLYLARSQAEKSQQVGAVFQRVSAESQTDVHAQAEQANPSDGAADAAHGSLEFEPVTDTSLLGVRVLVVDDEPGNLQAAQGMLETVGATVGTAQSGEMALTMLRQGEPRYEVVLMDLQMDGMDGLEATRQIRADSLAEVREVPVLAMTGKLMDREREKTAKAGMNGFLAKPVSMVGMVREIQRMLAPRADGQTG